MIMSNIENEMTVKYASLRIREETRDLFEDYRSQLQGERRNPNLTQDDGLLALLDCVQRERSRKK